MKKSNQLQYSKSTLSVHAGSAGDAVHGGLATPIYPSAAYSYDSEVRYPRYYNTPNLLAVAAKMAALEGAEDGIMFSTGMSAIMSSLLGVLNPGDHILFQKDLYGGTHVAAMDELPRLGIHCELADPATFADKINSKTRAIYLESPSNPLMKITDLKAVVSIARKHKLVTLIDNTFASPVNQNPFELGIDIVLHSGTKYIGGHGDLMCGIMVGSKKMTEKVRKMAVIHGATPDAFTAYMVERSLKTIHVRVQQQNKNAMAIAEFLSGSPQVRKVFYPGLRTHPLHAVAKSQMPGGFGGMLSFEIKGDPENFLSKLQIIRKAVSLGGVDSTINSPRKTSHAKLTPAERKAAGISDQLVRLSVGIEDSADLIQDIQQALRSK